MDANTSKHFYNYFMGMKQTLINHLEFRDQFYLFLILRNIFVYFYFISIKASIRNDMYHVFNHPQIWHNCIVNLGIKELLNKEQTGFKKLFTDYQPSYTINLLLNKELLPIQEMPNLGIRELDIEKLSKKETSENVWTNFGILH